MIQCPKCGFTQPPDRYCANCGVDMQAFKPKKSLLSNTYVQFVIAAIVVMGALTVINQKARERLASRAQLQQSENQSFVQMERPSSAESELETPPSIPPEESPSAEASSVAAAEPTLRRRQQDRPTNDSSNVAPTALATHLRVSFAEVSRPVIDEMLSQGRALSGFGNQQSAVIPGLQQRLTQGRTAGSTVKILSQSPSSPLQLNQTISVFEGYEDEDVEQKIGYTLQITPTLIGEQGIELQVEILREIKEYEDEETPVVISQPFQENFLLQTSEGALMTGTMELPEVIAEDDEDILAGTIFKIYGSEAFQDGQSDFVLFFEPLTKKTARSSRDRSR